MKNNYQYDRYHFEVVKETTIIPLPFIVGVQLQNNRGGRICYGFLGAKVKPHNKYNNVKISVSYTHRNLVRYKESGLVEDSFVYKGLPEEYVKQVRESIMETIMNGGKYPQCDIGIDYAANCEVGSSPFIFGAIAEILIKLICDSSAEKISDLGIEAFTEQYISKINLQY
jgi:hypothetical protein